MFASLYILINTVLFLDDPPPPPTGFPWDDSSGIGANWEGFREFLSNGVGVKGVILAMGVTASILCGIRMIISSDNATYAESKSWLINILITVALMYSVLSYLHL